MNKTIVGYYLEKEHVLRALHLVQYGYINDEKQFELNQKYKGKFAEISRLLKTFNKEKNLDQEVTRLSKGLLAINGQDSAMNGGIDLNTNTMDLQLQNAGQAMTFHMDPARLARLQNAPGFTPVIISIRPADIRAFLGLAGHLPGHEAVSP